MSLSATTKPSSSIQSMVSVNHSDTYSSSRSNAIPSASDPATTTARLRERFALADADPNSSAGGGVEIGAFERGDDLLHATGNRLRAPFLQIDENERLLGRHHQRVVFHPVGRELVGHARRPETRDAHEDLEQVVEACGCQVFDCGRAQDEVVLLVDAQQA